MERRNFIKWSSLLSALGFVPSSNTLAATTIASHQKESTGAQDRAYWVGLLDKI